MKNPKSYGFNFRKKDLYEPLISKTVVIDSTVENLVDFAIENKITYKILKKYNPWLRRNKITVRKGKKYFVKIPK